jgi:arsenate reductase
MAEGLLRALAGDRYEVFSAGSEPTAVHPAAVRVLREEGVDISNQRSKSAAEFAGQRFDYVITLCAEEVCPAFLGETTRLHWPLTDPAAVLGDEEAQRKAFRDTAGELRTRIRQFIGDDSE